MDPEAKRAARLLAASWAVGWAGVPISGAFSGIIVQHISGNLALVGVPFFLVYGGTLLASYPAGYFMDRYGRIPVLRAGAFVSAAGFSVSALAILQSNLWLFFGGHLVGAMGAAMSYLTRLAAADLYPPDQRARGVGRLLFFLALGAIASNPLIWLAQRLGPELGQSYLFVAWAIIPLLSLASATILGRIRVDPRIIGARLHPEPAPDPRLAQAPSAPIPWRPLIAAGGTLLFAQASMAALMSVTGPHLELAGHSPAFIVFTLNLHVIGMFLFSPLVGAVGDRWGRRRLLWISGLYLLVAAAAIGVWPHGPLMPSLLLAVGIGWSFAFVGATALVADVARVASRGRITGVIDQATAIVGGSASLLAGWILAEGGLGQVAAMAAALGAAGFLLGLVAPRHTVGPTPPARPEPVPVAETGTVRQPNV